MWLALSRKIGEEIHIGSEIIVKIGEIRDSQVKLLFKAPQKVKIFRGELKK